MKSIDKEFEEYVKLRPRSWPKLIKRLRMQMDDFIEEEIFAKGHLELKLGYLPLLMNIDPDGTTNSELSKRACITKQGMSKIVNDLAELGYVISEVDKNDARSSRLKLTNKGKAFLLSARKSIGAKTDEYRALVGKQNFEHLIDMMIKIMEYNEELEKKAQTSKYK